MIKPKMLGLLDFPTSTKKANGMNYLKADYDNMIVKTHWDIEYVKYEKPLYLNILVPTKQKLTLEEDSSTYPLIVYVQGSAWMKQNVLEHIVQLSEVSKQGYVVAIVQYRDTSIAGFPAQIEDTKLAISYLVEHSHEYHIDNEKILLWGDSSGAHTAVMTGISASLHKLESEEFKYADRIKGIIDYYGPTLISEMSNELSIQDHDISTSPEGLLLGGVKVSDHKEEAYKASPFPYLHKDMPPILIIHGNKDRLVPFGQSVMFYEALKEMNHDVTFYCLDGSDHGGAAFWNHQTYEITLEFIRKCLN